MDDWGIKTPSTSAVLPCAIKETISTQTQHNSKFSNFEYEISCEGQVVAEVGDMVEIYGKVFKIQKIAFQKDWGGNVYATKLFI